MPPDTSCLQPRIRASPLPPCGSPSSSNQARAPMSPPPPTEGTQGREMRIPHHLDRPQGPEAQAGRVSPRKRGRVHQATRRKAQGPNAGDPLFLRWETRTLPRAKSDNRCRKTATGRQRANVQGTKPLTEAQQKDKQATERGRQPRRGDPQKCRPTIPMTSGSRTFQGCCPPPAAWSPEGEGGIRPHPLHTPHFSL